MENLNDITKEKEVDKLKLIQMEKEAIKNLSREELEYKYIELKLESTLGKTLHIPSFYQEFDKWFKELFENEEDNELEESEDSELED